MAGSRLEKLGTIFTRVNGLLRSKAIQEENKPIWFDIYKRFPPDVEPRYDRCIDTRTIPNLLYPEDIIRARFYKLYGNPDVVDLTNEKVKTTCQKFIDNYFKLQEKETISEEELFKKAIESLKEQGIRLRTIAEKEAEMEAKAEASTSKHQSMNTFKEHNMEHNMDDISSVNSMDNYEHENNSGKNIAT
ncbi:28S ribosomal protein S23, mitochondrial-like [Argonauta hians]